MNTNQKFNMLRLLFLIGLLCFTNFAFGQNKNIVSNILLNGRRVPQTKINFKKSVDSKSESKTIQINDPIDSEATIHVLDENITVVLKSLNGTLVEIPGSNILSFAIKNDNERYELLKSGSNKKVVINKLKEYLGSVIATGLTERLQALTKGTVFELSLDNQELNVKLDTGKLNLTHIIKREIIDDYVLGNDGKRSLFIRENKQLKVKDGIYPNPEANYDSLPVLTDDKEIKKFLRKPFFSQKRELINTGEFSKKAVKDLEIDASKDEALSSFDSALENGELNMEFIIQSSLLFADTYLFNDEIEKSKIWLEVGVHYSNKLLESKPKILESDYLNNDSFEELEIDKAVLNSIRYEVLTANEFSAWAYDIKLKLYGCLENLNENPSKYRSNANKLIKAIEGKDN